MEKRDARMDTLVSKYGSTHKRMSVGNSKSRSRRRLLFLGAKRKTCNVSINDKSTRGQSSDYNNPDSGMVKRTLYKQSPVQNENQEVRIRTVAHGYDLGEF